MCPSFNPTSREWFWDGLFRYFRFIDTSKNTTIFKRKE